MNYTIKTTPMIDGRILQEIECEDNDIIVKVLRDVYDTKEKELEKALIKLGWTPPKKGE